MDKGLWINENTFVQFSDKTTKSLSEEIATRDRSIDFYSLGMYLPNPDRVLKKMGKDIDVYNELLTDAHVGSCVINRKAGVKSLEWSIDRGKAKSRQAKAIENAFKKLDIDRILSEILSAPLFGYQPLEIMWGDVDGLIMPVDIVGKPHRWFVFDEQNNPRFLTKTNMIIGEDLPPKKFIFPTHEWTYENPYGFPLLSRCFWPVTFKRGGYKFWVKFVEKYGMPWPIGKLPRGLDPTEYEKLADILERMVQDGIAVIPDDSSVELLTARGTGSGGGSGTSDLYERLLTYGDNEVSKALVGQTLTTEIGDKGSYAASKTHMEVRADIVLGDKRLCEMAFNQVIRWIYDYNWGSGDAPVFSMWEEDDVDKTLAERDGILSKDCGVRFTKEYYQREYGFEEGDIETVSSQQSLVNSQKEFAEKSPLERGRGVFPDQVALDDALDSITPDELQKQIEGVLKPVLELLKEGNSYDDILETLAEAYPDMDDNAIEEMLARAIFVSELWGRLNAEK